MNRSDKRAALLIGALLVLSVLVEVLSPRPVDWTESYSRYKRDPYACELVYDRLADLFPSGVSTVHEPIYITSETRGGMIIDPVTHFFIQERFEPSELDQQRLLRMVMSGDNALIAAERLPEFLKDTLKLSLNYSFDLPDSAEVARLGTRAYLSTDSSKLRFTCHPLRQEPEAVYVHDAGHFYFDNMEPVHTQVLATNEYGRAVLVRVHFGAGDLLLCSTPRVFTNYYLLRSDTRRFMANALSVLPDRPVVWSEFYKTGRLESRTPLRFMLSRRPLKIAYWCTVLLLALFIFVHAKRRQRAIPVVMPLRNTTKEFAETIGRLYYFKGDHADLARKMGSQFKEHVRQRLYLQQPVWDQETMKNLARRTGIGEDEWKHAFRLIEHFTSAPYVGPDDLLRLDRTLSGLRARL